MNGMASCLVILTASLFCIIQGLLVSFMCLLIMSHVILTFSPPTTVSSKVVDVWNNGPAVVGTPITFYAWYQPSSLPIDYFLYEVNDRFNATKNVTVI